METEPEAGLPKRGRGRPKKVLVEAVSETTKKDTSILREGGRLKNGLTESGTPASASGRRRARAKAARIRQKVEEEVSADKIRVDRKGTIKAKLPPEKAVNKNRVQEPLRRSKRLLGQCAVP